jgi:Protein of unknown function (DUF3108)
MKAVGSKHRRPSRILSAIVSASMLGLCALASAPASAKDQMQKITAEYSINFNGFGIGDFKLQSELNNNEYSIGARANISVLAGMLFEWKGNTTSTGQVMARRPHPYSYSFGYRTGDRGETIDVKFVNNNVEEIAVNPPPRPTGARVPITRKHMLNVVDPLSAVVMLTNIGSNKSATEVCNRRLPIFDGKQRYDIKLSYKATKTISAPNGYNGPAYVCKAKFVPIAGHKEGDKENEYAAKTEGMEVWMMPLAKAELYVPYYVYIPTPVGAASLTSTGFSVEGGADGRRALVR